MQYQIFNCPGLCRLGEEDEELDPSDRFPYAFGIECAKLHFMPAKRHQPAYPAVVVIVLNTTGKQLLK
jgi:hypothetical protein